MKLNYSQGKKHEAPKNESVVYSIYFKMGSKKPTFLKCLEAFSASSRASIKSFFLHDRALQMVGF